MKHSIYLSCIAIICCLGGCHKNNKTYHEGNVCDTTIYYKERCSRFKGFSALDASWSSCNKRSFFEITSIFDKKGGNGYTLFIGPSSDDNIKHFKIDYAKGISLLEKNLIYMKEFYKKDHINQIHIQMSIMGDASVDITNIYNSNKKAKSTFDEKTFKEAIMNSRMIADINRILAPYHMIVKDATFELVADYSIETLKIDNILELNQYPSIILISDDLYLTIEKKN